MNIKDLDKENVFEVAIKNNVSIVTQRELIEKLIKNITYENEYGLIEYNSINIEVCKLVSFASIFTDLELLVNDYENYDILDSSNIKHVFKDEYRKYEALFDSRMEDKIREHSIDYLVLRQVDRLTDKAIDVMDMFNKVLEKGDPNKIAKYLSKGIEMVARKLPDFSDEKTIEKVAKTFKGFR